MALKVRKVEPIGNILGVGQPAQRQQPLRVMNNTPQRNIWVGNTPIGPTQGMRTAPIVPRSGVRPAAPSMPDNRGALSRFWDQINMLDNNRTWKQATPTNTASAFNQAAPMLPLGLNTVLTRGRQSLDALTGHSEREADRWLQELNQGKISHDLYQRLLKERMDQTAWAGSEDKGGVDRARMAIASGIEFLGGYAGGRVGLGIGGKAVNQGVREAVKGQGRNLAMVAGLGGAESGATANLDSGGDIAATALGATAGTVLNPVADVGLGALGAVAGKVVKGAARAVSGADAAPALTTTKIDVKQPTSTGTKIGVGTDKVNPRFTDIHSSAKNAVTDSKMASEVSKAWSQTGSGDPVSIVNQIGVAATTRKAAGKLVDSLNLGITKSERSKLMNKIIKATSPEEVGNLLGRAADTATEARKATVSMGKAKGKAIVEGIESKQKPKASIKEKVSNSKTSKQKPKVSQKGKVPKGEKAPPTAKQVYEVTKKGPGAVKRLFGHVSHNIRQYGKGGKAIAKGLDQARNEFEKNAGRISNRFRNNVHDKLTKEEFTQMWDAIEATGKGEKPRVPKHVAAAARETAQIMKEIHNLAKEAGMEIGDVGSSYLPHIFKSDQKNMVGFIDRKFNKKYGNLEKTRTGEIGYEKTTDAIYDYISHALERIARAKQFGQGDEKLKAMFESSAKEGYDVSRLGRYTDIALGKNDQSSGWHQASSAIRQFNAITSLQRSFMANLSQPANTLTRAGVKNTLKAYGSIIKETILYDRASRPNLNWARDTGVALDSILSAVQKQQTGAAAGGHGVRGFLKNHVLIPGMQATEEFNRKHAVIAGRYWAEDLGKRAAKGNKNAIRILSEFSPDYRAGKALTDDVYKDVGRKVVERTQFKIDPQDLPSWASTPVGKIISQFRSFGYKQTEFIARDVIGEAMHGNFAPMTRYVLLGMPIAYGFQEGRDKLTSLITPGEEKEYEDKRPAWKKGLDVLSNMTGSVAFSEIDSTIKNYDYSRYEGAGASVTSAIAGWFGPTTSTINRGARAVGDAVEGKFRSGTKFLASKIPVVGPYASKYAGNWFDAKGDKPLSEMTPKELDSYKRKHFAEFRGGLSKEDQELFDVAHNYDASTIAIRSGKYTQDQIDEMDTRYNQAKFRAGLPIKYINSIKEEDFMKMSPSVQGVVLEASLIGKKKFLDDKTVNPASKHLVEEAMKESWPNVGEIEPSNKLALDMIESSKRMSGYDNDAEKYDELKSFWNKAVKQQYSSTIQQMYGDSIADIKRLTGEGVTINDKTYRATKQDLDKLIELDDRLLVAGLRDTPKFSKKVRKEAGYGAPPVSKLEGTGYQGPKSSSGGGGSRKNKHVNPYAYEVKPKSRGAAPKVSIRTSGGSSFGSVGGGRTTAKSKPKVSLKKSKV